MVKFTVRGTTLGYMALGCRREWTENAIESKLPSIAPPWPLLKFLPSGSFLEFWLCLPFMIGCNCKLNEHTSQVSFGHGLLQQ